MNELLEAAEIVSAQLLPIIGVIALIFLCILLSKATKLLVSLTSTVKNLDGTMKRVDTSIDKAQVPLDTAVKISKTVDEIHDKSYTAVKQASEYVVENLGVVKSYVNEKMNSNTKGQQETKTDEEV